MHHVPALFVTGAVALALACQKPPGGDQVPVVGFTPATGEVTRENLRDGIRVTFARAVAPPGDIGRVLTTPAFTIEPPVPGEARWLDAQTLAFLPGESLRPSVAYRVKLARGLQLAGGARLPDWAGLRFVHDRLTIERVGLAGDRLLQQRDPVLTLVASQPLAPASAGEACGFFARAGAGSLGPRIGAVPLPGSSRSGDGQRDTPALMSGRALRLKPDSLLAPGKPYLLRCGTGLQPAAGGEGIAKVHEEAFSTYGPAAVLAVGPAGKDIAADAVEIRLEFSTPMDPGEIRKRVKLSGHGSGATPLELAANHRQTLFTWSGDLQPGTDYELVVPAGLTDRFGQRLHQGRRHHFRVGDASPRLQAETGIYTMERGSPGQPQAVRYPVWTRNLSRFELRCAPVPERKLVAVLTGPANDDAWWGSDRGAIDWSQLGLRQRSAVVRPDPARNRWHDHALDLGASCGGGAGGGLYLLELATSEEVDHHGRARPRERRSLVNVTDLGLLAKVGNASSLIWLVRLSSGTPVAGAAVTIRDLKGRVRFSGTTGPDGVVAAPGAARLLGVRPGNAAQGGDPEPGEGDWEDFRGRRVIVAARSGDDLAVLDTNWNNGIQNWNFGVEEDKRGGERRVRGFLHSDRGLYRPGDTVHLRGLVRVLDRQGRMSVPRGKTLQLVIEDPRGSVIEQSDLPVSAFGGFFRDVVLDGQARLGDWHVRASYDGWTVSERFSVEEYRPRTFEVKVKPGRPHLYLGQKLAFDVEGRWLYGSPLRGGKLTWTIRRRPHLPQFEGWGEYAFRDLGKLFDEGHWWARDDERSFSDTVADGQAVLDDQGRARIETPDVVKGLTGPQDYLFEATVADGTGQAVSNGGTIIAHQGDLYLGLHPSETLQAAGMPFAVQLVAFDREGKRRPASAELSFTRRRYDCGHDPADENAGWHCRRVEETNPSLKRTVAVPASGSGAALRVSLSEPGEYLVEVSAPDGRGGRARSSDVIYLVGKGEAFWSGDEGERMAVVASKARYKPGEVARLLPQAQLPGALALVTLERDGILRHQVRTLASTGEALEIPIEPNLAPNVFASVTLVRGRSGAGDKHRPRFKMGLTNLEVDTADRRLQVEVTTERPSYEPGQMVKARLRVKSQDGTPVRAELAVAAADEGVLQILGYKTPDPLPAFYAPFGLGVESATTWNRLLRARSPSDEDDAEEGGDAGGEEAGRVRSRFVATAFWTPALVTGADGSAQVSFPAPDNLTAFRVMAVAADTGERFGAGEVRFTVAKALQVVPSLPRFLSQGDQAQVTVMVHNNTRGRLAINLRASSVGVSHLDGETRALELAAHSARPVLFGIRATGTGEASFTFTADGSGLQDAVVVKLPIEEPTARSTMLVAEGSTAGKFEAQMPTARDALPHRGGLEVLIDRTGLARLDEGFGYLVGYPYGCLEQTTSKVVPMVALHELAGAGAGATAQAADRRRIDGFVKAGIAKILRHQHDGGGFGLWIGAPPELHYTAYALWGLELARRAGYPVEERARKDGIHYLKSRLGERPASGGSASEIAGEAGASAFAHYVLAELGDAQGGALAALYERRRELPVYGRAFLLRGLVLAKRTDLAPVLAGELAALVPGGGGPVILREGMRELDWYWSSDVRSTALVLLALLDASPGHPAIARLTEGLLGARSGGRWSSTQENVYGLTALAALARSRAAGPPAAVVVTVNGRERARFSLAGMAAQRLHVPMTELGPGPFALAVTGATVFYAARLHVERALGPAAEDVGLAVRREYLDPDTGAPLARIKLGQMVKVRLTVTSPARLAHVAVLDQLPAGLEPVLTRFRRSYTGEEDERARALWWRQGAWQTAWQHEELRDDRALVFADALAAGPSQHEYLARATTAGRFTAPPAQAEAMYRPEINGQSAAGTLVVER